MRKNKKLFITIGIIISALVLVYIQLFVPENIQNSLKLRAELQQKEKDRPAFESELLLVMPASLRKELATYDNTFEIYYLQEILSNHEFGGYTLTRTFRVRDYTEEEMKIQIQEYMQRNGYTVTDDRLDVTASPRDFKVDFLFIPFPQYGYIDVKVTLFRDH